MWCRPAAVAPTQPLAWELPDAKDVALEKEKKKSISILYHIHQKILKPFSLKKTSNFLYFSAEMYLMPLNQIMISEDYF